MVFGMRSECRSLQGVLNRNAPGGKNWVWPAVSADGGTGADYTGTGNVYMGTLLAIPANVDITTFTQPGTGAYELARALQDYGGYVCDRGYMNIYIDPAAESEADQYLGPYFEVLKQVGLHLQVVTNNGPNSVGGGGTRRRPLAPPFIGGTTKQEWISSFEGGEPQPSWNDSADLNFWTAGNNPIGVSGYLSNISPECSVRSGEAAHTGSSALMYSGTANGVSTNYLYYKVVDLSSNPISIVSNSAISYWIYPQTDNARYVGVDFHCTDGSTLRDSGIIDSNGASVHPNAGHGGNIGLNSWTQINASLASLAGKSIDRIWVAYDRPGSTGQYRGYIDDINIDPPTAAVPGKPTGVTATAGNAQVKVSWTAPSGTVTSYKLYRSTTAGGEGTTAYKSALTGSSYTDTGLTNGTTYYYKVAAVNSAGTGAQSVEVSGKPVASVTKVNDNNSKAVYSGSWVTATQTGYYNSDEHYSNVTNASVTFSFTGTSVSWIGGKNSEHGKASVSVDGGTAVTVDTYSASTLSQQTLFTKSGLATGNHTLKITVTNSKTAASTGYYQDVDAFTFQ